jgi:MoxR-like ATPase
VSQPDFDWDGDTEGVKQSPSEPETNGSTLGADGEENVSSPVSIEDYDLRRVVTDEFSEVAWDVMEALLATHATMLLNDVDSSRGMMVEGPSGSGKTMLLRSFNGLTEQFIRRDDITPASLVSAEPSKDEEELENDDLLPMLDGKTLVVRDAGPWFSGSREHTESRWAKMASAMDGDGYKRHTASHGTRGYEDVRFNFIGATTPLPPRAWDAMGNVGQRVLFVEWPEENNSKDDLRKKMQGGERESVERTQTAVNGYLDDLWERHGGEASVSWPDDEQNGDVFDGLYYLTELVRHGRATVYDGTERVDREAQPRIFQHLQDLARGHALLHGRRTLELSDLDVCARVALSTIPARRRPSIRLLLDPTTDNELTATEVDASLGVSRKTAHNRIDMLGTLQLAEVYRESIQGGKTKVMSPSADFVWPVDLLEFPRVDR